MPSTFRLVDQKGEGRNDPEVERIHFASLSLYFFFCPFSFSFVLSLPSLLPLVGEGGKGENRAQEGKLPSEGP